MATVAVVGALGAVGSVLRYLLAGAVTRVAGAFPAGTMVVNVLGAATIGLVMAVFAARGELASPLRIGLTAGLLGGFTTYSSFAFETFELLERRSYLAAGLQVASTVGLCLAACAGGALLGRWLAR